MASAIEATDGEQWVTLYGRRLLRAAIILCREEDEARDLVQEALCRAIVSAKNFRGEAAPYTWLYAIMRNLYFKRRRRHLLWRFWQETSGEHFDHSFQPDAEREYDHGVLAESLRAAISRLPARHREILLLRYVEGLKIPEIAETIGLATGTVKSRLYHATRRLQRYFTPAQSPLPVPRRSRP